MVIISKGRGKSFKHVIHLIGLFNLVVTIGYSPCSYPKVDDVAHVAFVLIPISIGTKVGGVCLQSRKVI